jgi:hypothetical protein
VVRLKVEMVDCRSAWNRSSAYAWPGKMPRAAALCAEVDDGAQRPMLSDVLERQIVAR